MKYEECFIGQHVRINLPGNPTLHNETGIVCSRDEMDEAGVRFDVYKPKFDQYGDTRRGYVTLEPTYLEPV